MEQRSVRLAAQGRLAATLQIRERGFQASKVGGLRNQMSPANLRESDTYMLGNESREAPPQTEAESPRGDSSRTSF